MFGCVRKKRKRRDCDTKPKEHDIESIVERIRSKYCADVSPEVELAHHNEWTERFMTVYAYRFCLDTSSNNGTADLKKLIEFRTQQGKPKPQLCYIIGRRGREAQTQAFMNLWTQHPDLIDGNTFDEDGDSALDWAIWCPCNMNLIETLVRTCDIQVLRGEPNGKTCPPLAVAIRHASLMGELDSARWLPSVDIVRCLLTRAHDDGSGLRIGQNERFYGERKANGTSRWNGTPAIEFLNVMKSDLQRFYAQDTNLSDALGRLNAIEKLLEDVAERQSSYRIKLASTVSSFLDTFANIHSYDLARIVAEYLLY
jgi:hypothetical protein